MSDLRPTFIKELAILAEQDKNIMLLIGDVGYSFAEPFEKESPGQLINCGTIEQSMVDIAVGLALSGKKPYVYTVINFILFRAYEQVRNDVCYMNTNVKLVGVRGKESYKFLGYSHNIAENEDRDILKRLPNIFIALPKTDRMLHSMMQSTYKSKVPTYIRL